LETASIPRFALYVHRSVMVTNDLVHSREAESGSPQAGRVERLEQSSCYDFVEPVPAVDNSQTHVTARHELAVTQLDEGDYVFLLRSYADISAAFHSVRRVGAQIKDNLLQLGQLAGHDNIHRDVLDDELDAEGQ